MNYHRGADVVTPATGTDGGVNLSFCLMGSQWVAALPSSVVSILISAISEHVGLGNGYEYDG